MVAGNFKGNINEEDLPDFNDPEDFVDDISDEDLLPELMSKEPRLQESTEKIIVVDNIPKAGTDKRDKLKRILQNLLGNYSKIVNEYYPEDESETLRGYLFVEYDTEASAQEAVAHLNGYRLDKSHTFKVNFFSDFKRYKEMKFSADAETPAPYKNPGNLNYWLCKPECHDQFCTLTNDIFTTVSTNTPLQPTVVKEREKWTETRFQWSPKGTYLATFHDRGIALWAGEEFNQFMRFSHHGVQLIDFSPCENYLVTCNPNRAGIDDQALVIWCVRSGQQMRSFTCERTMNLSWPHFKWNKNDKYFARLAIDSLLVYDTANFTLLEKKSIKIPYITDFEWSPTQNVISYWVAEHNNVPARVVLMEIPTKREIRSKNLVNVVEAKMFWQSAGEFLCVRVERYKKANIVKEDDKDITRYSGIYFNFDFYRIKEKDIPVDSIEIKDICYSFAWEPNGQKFTIIYGDSPSRTNAAFYRISNSTANVAGKLELIKEFKNKAFLQISWSPQGNHCVLAATTAKQQQTTPHAEFYDASSNTDVTPANKFEHEHMTDFEWDPTGRYFVTYVSYWNYRLENAYLLWNFQGKAVQPNHKAGFERLYKFGWRPRPAPILSAEQLKEIKKNLKSYSEKYTASDRIYQMTVSKEQLDKRKKLMDEFNEFRKIAVNRFNEQRDSRIEMRDGFDTYADETEEIEYSVQFLVETKKEELND